MSFCILRKFFQAPAGCRRAVEAASCHFQEKRRDAASTASTASTARVLAFACAAALCLASCARRETPVERGNREQILLRGVGPEITTLDPHLATGAAEYNILSALLEGLVTENPVTLAPEPGVAESWRVSPDGLVYTFMLRADARWSNGEPVTAADFVASFKRILTASLGANDAPHLYIIQNAEAYHKGRLADFSKVGVAAADSRTLRVTLEHPCATFLAMLNQTAFMPVYLPAIEKNGAADSRANDWARPGKFVGNGPFTLATWRLGQKITVAKSKTYWDAANVRLNGIEFFSIESRDAEERAFRAGQLHLTESLAPSKIDAYRRDAPQLLRIDPYLGTEFYRINTARPFLNDARVRRALSLAIDRGIIVEKILRGGQQPATSFTPPGIDGYAPPDESGSESGSGVPPLSEKTLSEKAARRRFHPAPVGASQATPESGFAGVPTSRTISGVASDAPTARKLLAEAGYPDGKGAPPVELLFNTSESHRAVAEAVQEMWRRELGLRVTLLNQENKTLQTARETGDYQLLRSVWIADYADPLSFLEIWTASSGNNYTGWSDATYDQLLYQAARAPDRDARDALLRKAETLLLQQAPFIPIYHYTHVFLIQPSVQGWHPTLLDHHSYKSVWLKE